MPSMVSWSERSYYSIGLDCAVARISGFDEHHQEHWVEIEKGVGYRDRRLEALETIERAIKGGASAGPVEPEKKNL